MPDGRPPSDFDVIGQMNPGWQSELAVPPPATLAGNSEFDANRKELLRIQSMMVAQDKDHALPETNNAMGDITIHKDGTISVRGADKRYVEGLLDSRKKLDEIMGAFHQEITQNQAQLDRARQQPWQQLATTLSANLAQAPNMPGWVQGLGRTAAELNPTVNQLQARKMAMLGQEAGMAEKRMALDVSVTRMLTDTRQIEHQRKLEEGVNKTATDYLKQTRLAIRGGSGEPLSYEAFVSGGVAVGVPPERLASLYRTHVEEAKLAAEGKEADLSRSKRRMTFKESLDEELAGKKGEISKGVRRDAIDHAYNKSISQSKFDFDIKLHDAKKAIDESAAGRKELTVLGPKVSDGLKQASATNQYLSSTQSMLERPEMAEVQGPLFQFNPKTNEVTLNSQAVIPKSFKGVERTVVESQISHEIPRLLTLLLNGQAGGASILRTDIGKKLVADMGITGSIRPDQALAILKIVRDSNNTNIASIMREKPRAAWGELKDLTGVDDPLNYTYFHEKKDSFGGPVRPFPASEKTIGTGAKPAGKTDYGAAPAGAKEGDTGTDKATGKKYVVRNGRWVDA